MAPSRRALLAAAGGIGAAGVGGYLQRRRLVRLPAWTALRPIPRIAVPDVDASPVVTDTHLDRATSLLDTRLDAFDGRDVDELDRTHADWIDRARENRDEAADAGGEGSNADRLELLERLHQSTSLVGTVIARVDDDRGELTEGGVDDRVEEVRETLADVDVAYTGDAVTAATIQLAEAESALADARRIADDLDGREPLDRLELLGRVETNALDAEEFSASTDGPSREQRLEERGRTLAERTDAVLEDVEFEYDGADAPNAAADVRTTVLSRRRPDGDLPARFVRDGAYVYAIARSLESLTELPTALTDRDRFTDRRGFEVADIEAAKRDAVDAIAAGNDTDGDDPLARFLLGRAIARVEGGDRKIENLRGNVNRIEDGFWAAEKQEALVDYRVAAGIAARVSEITDVVAG